MTDAPEAPKVDRMAHVRAARVAKRAERAAAAAQAPQPEAVAAPAATRGTVRQAPRQAAPRGPMRDPRTGNITVMGRDGEVLTRKRTTVGDMYEIPLHLIPNGWSYQWNTFSVVEKEITDQQVMMAENGWRPVPAARHPGQFMPAGYTGAIIRGGLRLEERPIELTQWAREEANQRARAQIHDRNSSLRLTRDDKIKSNGGLIDTHHPELPNRVNFSIDQGADIPHPQYQEDTGA